VKALKALALAPERRLWNLRAAKAPTAAALAPERRQSSVYAREDFSSGSLRQS
jgi:hypothetical protein